jgi:hypothetical protein
MRISVTAKRIFAVFGVITIIFSLLAGAYPWQNVKADDTLVSMNVWSGDSYYNNGYDAPFWPMQAKSALCYAKITPHANVGDVVKSNGIFPTGAVGTAFDTIGSAPSGDGLGSNVGGDQPSGEAKTVYDAAQKNSGTPTVITFDSPNSGDCKRAGIMIQSPTTPTKFYGILLASVTAGGTTYGSTARYITFEATIDTTAQTVNFLDELVTHTSQSQTPLPPPSDVSLHIANFAGNEGLFSGDGSGSGGGDACPGKLSDVKSKDSGGTTQLEKCLSATDFSFTQQNTIAMYLHVLLNGTIQTTRATFVSEHWGGGKDDDQKFVLVGDVTGDTALNNEACPDNGKSYITMDYNYEDGTWLSLYSTSTFKAGLESFGSGNFTLGGFEFHLNNCNSKDSVHAPITSAPITKDTINIVGRYNPGSDDISTVFTDGQGGDHESDVIGSYIKDTAANSPTKFIRDSSSVSSDHKGCVGTGATPYFALDSDPSKAAEGALIHAIWYINYSDNDGCNKPLTPINVQIIAAPKDTNSPPPDTDNQTPVDTQSLGCDFQISNPLTWVLCPVINMMTRMAGIADNIITKELYIDPNSIFCGAKDPACQGYYTAWQSFRNIALGLMVVGGLVMLISQALGYELLDAYTIRKVLPRLLIAALGITLSWPLMKFAVQLSDDLGFGIRSLIYAPFNGLNNGYSLNLGSYGFQTLFGTLGVGASFVAWMVFGGPAAIFSYVGTALLAILIAVIVLVLRQIAITLLIVVAPLAIVAFILPNTQKTYRLWWESFSKALLMFPIIAGFIASGRVFSAIANHQAQQNGANITGFLSGTIGILAYFAPYFMIPFTFRLAGGAISQLGGLVNDRSKGAFDRLRNGRAETRQKRLKAAHTGGIYRNDHALGRRMNKLGNWTIDFPDTATQTFGQKRGFGWALGRRGRILSEGVAHSTLEHSRKAAQAANLHYSSGRAVAGLHHYALDEFKQRDEAGNVMKDQNGNPLFKSEAHQRAHDTMKSKLDKEFGIRDPATGAVTGYRAAQGELDVEKLATIYGGAGPTAGQNTRYAAVEMSSKAAMLGSFKGAGKEETQRADIETIGLMSAAQAGRLEDHEIAESTNKALRGEGTSSGKGGDSGGFAFGRDAMLRDIATPKRVEQARGHGGEFDVQAHGKHVEAVAKSVYDDPTSAAAQKSWMRISSQELASGKSEALVALNDTMIAAASDYEYTYDKDTKQLKPVELKDAEGNSIPGSHVLKTGDKAVAAQQARERLKSIAAYAYGDTGVGVALKKITNSIKVADPDVPGGAKVGMGDLSWGARGSLDPVTAGQAGNAPQQPVDPNAPPPTP